MNINKIRKNEVLSLCFDFSLLIIDYCEQLEVNRKYTLAKQLFRSATAIGANAMEAQHAESRPDFIHKFKVAIKEGEETEYWLLLCKHSLGFPDPTQLLIMIERINKIIGRIIITTKNKSIGEA